MNSNYTVGHGAEKRAADYLQEQGFKILGLNWKTRYCEIDIVAEKAKTIHFVEVKYRRNTKQGYGLDYITTKKLERMRFAAEMWVNSNSWAGEYRLAAISLDGDEITFIDDV
jgi:uncharacterized protein (TIGR00252 family)